MLRYYLRLPLFMNFALVGLCAMCVPAIHAVYSEEFHVARSFFYTSVLGVIVLSFIAIALSNRPARQSTIQHLFALLCLFAVLPLLLAVPFYEALGTTSFLNAYLEMVSCLTTTGATLFDRAERLPDSLHLWRAIVAWLGGLIMWLAASAILAPLNLGGFEVTTSAEPGQGRLSRLDVQAASPGRRLQRSFADLAPIYGMLTGILWLCLTIAGEPPFQAAIFAMATLSTSGVTAGQELAQMPSGWIGELLIFLFLFFGLSRLTFSTDTISGPSRHLMEDPEFRIGIVLILGIPTLLFVRHWSAALDVNAEKDIIYGIAAFWGAMFSSLSFLTTTGFVSSEWQAAQGWSGLGTPGIILMGLALMGGGVATTAGGVKLLRVFTLYLNGLREIQRLIHPHSVSGKGQKDRRIRRQGAFTAWVFFMLFALSMAAITMAMTGFGASFEEAIVLSVSALSTTGPLLEWARTEVITLAELSDPAKLVFAASCILGRLETLAIIAMITPQIWRR